MNVVEALLIAFSVSLDAFALSVSGALTCRRGETAMCALKAAGFFGGFQFFMPLAGFFAAALLEDAVEKYDHWIAFALLAAVGGKMIAEALRGGENSEKPSAAAGFFRCRNLIVPAVATSIDALAVGAGLAFSGSPILVPAAAMGKNSSMHDGTTPEYSPMRRRISSTRSKPSSRADCATIERMLRAMDSSCISGRGS